MFKKRRRWIELPREVLLNQQEAPQLPPAPLTLLPIDPKACVNAAQAAFLVDLREACIRKDVKTGRLKAARRGHEWAISIEELGRVYTLKRPASALLEREAALTQRSERSQRLKKLAE